MVLEQAHQSNEHGPVIPTEPCLDKNTSVKSRDGK